MCFRWRGWMSSWGPSTEPRPLELDLRVQRETGQQVGAAGAAGFGDRGVEVVLGLGAGLRGGGGQGGGHDVGDLVQVVRAQAEGGQGGGTEADAGGVPGAVGVAWDRVAVGDHARLEEGSLGLPAGPAVAGGPVGPG